MPAPLVTVAIPSYNRPAFLREALASVLAQEYQDFAILVADDCSSFDVAALLHAFHDSRIRLLRQPRHVGVIQNWRASLCTPTTRYVAHLDDDDLWLPHHLGEAVRALEAYPAAPFYTCTAQRFGARDGIMKPYWCHGTELEVSDWHATGYGVWLPGCTVSSSSVVLRREALEGLFWGGESWPWCHDWLWWGQLALLGPLLFQPRSGVKYRWHHRNDTSKWLTARGRAHWLYTVRELATRAWAAGGLRDLASEIRGFPASALSTVVIALTAPESPPALAQQARQVFETRREIASQPGCARHYRIAAAVGGWWLRYADVSTRLLGRWWPAPGSTRSVRLTAMLAGLAMPMVAC
jgi:glycosyltransferase involved in cell wall biosynthesis